MSTSPMTQRPDLRIVREPAPLQDPIAGGIPVADVRLAARSRADMREPGWRFVLSAALEDLRAAFEMHGRLHRENSSRPESRAEEAARARLCALLEETIEACRRDAGIDELRANTREALELLDEGLSRRRAARRIDLVERLIDLSEDPTPAEPA